MFTKRKRTLNKRFILIFTAIVILSILAYFFCFYKNYNKFSTIPVYSQKKNALWARHQWVGEQHSSDEYKKLAQLLKDNKITDVFFHVGPLNIEGKIGPEKYHYAKDLVVNLKKEYPELHVQAWIGQVEKKGGGILDLSKVEIRSNITETSRDFLELGFDGIHYNIEPIYSNDSNFVDLLIKTKKLTSSQNKILSVASDELEPFWGAEKIARVFSKQAGFWNKDFYHEIASNVDQVAVMMYDTALPIDWMYAFLVSWETKQLTSIVNPETVLFIGVPSYEERRWSFHPSAENVESGLRGVKEGLSTLSKERLNNVGVAIYAEWTTDSNEWKVYKRLWLK